jgi:prepilin-type N-terminal cleavage/methylation domain-containing protein
MTCGTKTGRRSRAQRRPRAFSLIEMLVALAITAALLSASLAALDTSFKSYQVTSESASTHVVTRIVMHRMLSMIRVGTEFAPFPNDVLDVAQNPMVLEDVYDPMAALPTGFQLEFVSRNDLATGDRQITRFELRDADPADGSKELWLMLQDIPGAGGPAVTTERPLLTGVVNAIVTLDYDVGPKLRQANIDLIVLPNDIGDDIEIALNAPTIRLVASASPRNLE